MDTNSFSISIRVSENEKDIISKMSKLHNCSISSWIREVIFHYIENEYDIKITEKFENV